jgi:hypothetical protein
MRALGSRIHPKDHSRGSARVAVIAGFPCPGPDPSVWLPQGDQNPCIVFLSYPEGNPIQSSLLAEFRESVAARYLVHEVVGRGGMSTVLRATRLQDGLIVAIKVLDPRLQEVVGADRFRREIRILSRLEHPAILPLLESGDEPTFLYFVMPFVAGQTLRQHLEREPQLAVDAAVGIAVTVLDALEYAHGKNVIHRDIKPENILLDDGRPLVADFGIARAIILSGGTSISSTGIVIGTPAYMSPEQAAGETRIDARSDVYATACLLYEMLAGNPPFTGSTAQAIQARHLHQAPPPLRIVRPAIPQALETVIGRALAKVPGDRYASAAEFSRALTRSLTDTTPSRGKKGSRRLWITGGSLVAIAAAALLLRPSPAPVDPERYLVLPFRQHGVASVGGLSGADYARLVWQTLARKWRDLRLVDEAVVEDRLRQTGDSTLTLSRGIELARSLGAGLVVWGDVERFDDSVHLQASLYQVEHGLRNALQGAEVHLPTGVTSVAGLMDPVGELARGLLLPELAKSADQGTLVATPYFAALRATLSGDSAMVNWNLALARTKYREASSIDPQYAAPRLHFAQASLWANAPVAEWGPAAEAALGPGSELSALERLEAQGLVALGHGEYPSACERFGAMLARDSLRFAGWFGLGECQTRDSIVVPDASSPSGWRFRGNYTSGIAAYIRALRLVPLSHVAYGGGPALARLADKLHAESNRLRIGVASTDPARRFAAFPSLDRSEITFVPYPINEVISSKRMPASRRQALDASRKILRDLTSDWLARYPDSPPAIEAHAWSLELAGEIVSPVRNGLSALALVQRLRTSAATRTRQVELGAWEVRLLLKARRYTQARLVADSMLMLTPANSGDTQLQAGLAALIGRINRAAELAVMAPETFYILPSGESFEAPTAVAAAAQRLLTFAAFGAPAESIQASRARLERVVGREVEVARQRKVLEAVSYRANLLAFPLLPAPAGELEINRLEAAVARNDRVAAHDAFAALAAMRESQSLTVAPDHVLLEARLLTLIGDSVAARSRLEGMLDDLSLIGRDFFDSVTQPAALPRAMRLYGELGGRITARGLDSSLAALWRNGDGALTRR